MKKAVRYLACKIPGTRRPSSKKLGKSASVVSFGVREEGEAFVRRHSRFFERFSNLKQALDIAFIRTGQSGGPAGRVVFLLGRLCVEDFMEILLLAGNGYGIGAQKIVRGMFERAVTARYLHLNPDETQRFLDYHWVQQHKLANAIQTTIGRDVLSAEILDDVRANFERVKNDFLVTACEQCGRTDLNYTWSRMDLVSMANATGFGKSRCPRLLLTLARGSQYDRGDPVATEGRENGPVGV